MIRHDDYIKLQAEIIERMSEGVLLLTRDGVIHFANNVAELTLGYKPGALLGSNAALLSFHSPQEFLARLHTAFDATEHGASALIDIEARHGDGNLLPLQARFSGLQLGDVRYVIAVITDVSTRRQLEREMMQIATEVQVRVGGDLHEGLGQQLSGIAMILRGLAAREASGATASKAELDEVVALINGAVHRTRLLARGLSPVRPNARGIGEGMAELVNSVHEVYGQRVRLALDLPPELTVDENCATALFHIAQEAVENAARHAGAREIEISFRIDGTDLELQVTDDGVGFDPAHMARMGMGLRMMRFRAEMARGFLSIESQPGQGARLRCRCPARTENDA